MSTEIVYASTAKKAMPLPKTTSFEEPLPSQESLTLLLAGVERPARERSFFFSLAMVLIGFAVFRGPLIIWSEDGLALANGTSLLVLGLAMVLAVAFRHGLRQLPSMLHPGAYLLGVWLVFASDWLIPRYNFFQGPTIRGEIICGALLALFLLRQRFLGVFSSWAFVVSACLALGFFQLADGRLLFTDDHTSVFYRLTMLQENFPAIPFYNPFWNAGMDARDFFSTGILNLYLLFYPVWHFFRVEQVYNGVVAAVVFGLVPLSMFFAGRILRLSVFESALSAALSLSSSLIWYRWCFKYGAMGFVTSVALLPLVVASGLQILRAEEELTVRESLVFIVLSALVLCWAMTVVALLPLVIFALLRFRRVMRFRRTRMIAGSLVFITLPWVIVWLNVADVFHFVGQPSSSFVQPSMEKDGEDIAAASPEKPKKASPSAKRGKSRKKPVSVQELQNSVRDFARNTNPLLLLFGLPGLFLMLGGTTRHLLLSLVAWLLVLGVLLSPFKPQLELDRMLVICAAVLCLPAGKFLGELILKISGRDRPWTPQLVASLACGFFFCGLPSSGNIVWNRSLENYYFADNIVGNMADAILKHGGEGRTMFAGFTLHELNHGHVAPLAYFTKRPLMASSPFHNTWWYTDIIPEYYRDAGPAKVEEFLTAMNVTSIIAHDQFWRRYYSERPDQYQRVWEEGPFVFFRRTAYQANYFLEGQGKVIGQASSDVTVRIDSDAAVLKFRYFPFLQSTGCELFAHPIPGDIELLGLRKCLPGSTIQISSVGAFRRVFN